MTLFQVNSIVVFMHWGVEYTVLAEVGTVFFEHIKMLSEDVDVIIGCHTHVTQGHLYYRETLIAPQIGNFLFPMHLTPSFVSKDFCCRNSSF